MYFRSSGSRFATRDLFAVSAALLAIFICTLAFASPASAARKQLSIDSPRSGSTLSRATTVKATLPAGVSSAKASLSVDGRRVASKSTRIDGSRIHGKFELGGLKNGRHTLTVKASFRLGGKAVSSSASRQVSVKRPKPELLAAAADKTAPSAPGKPAVSSITQTSAVLKWSAATDNVGVSSYDINVDGKWFDWTRSLTYTMKNLTCGKSYRVYIVALDAARNYKAGAATEVRTASCSTTPPPTPTPDTTPPSAVTGLAASNVSATSATLSWNAASDNVGVTRYAVVSGGASIASTAGLSATVSLSCGTARSFSVAAFDAAGNTATSAPISVTGAACAPAVDDQAPSAPSGLAISAITQTGASLSWNASTDNVGVTSYDINVNNSWLDWTRNTSHTISGLTCGTTYSVKIIALDAARNYAAGQPVNFTTVACAPAQDTTAPSAPSGLSSANVTQTGATLSWNVASDNVGVTRYEVRSGGETVASTTGLSTSVTLNCGVAKSFVVVAFDAAGNSATSSPITITGAACPATPGPDSQAPSAPTGLAFSSITQTGATLTWNASSDNVAVTSYDINVNNSWFDWTRNTSHTISGLTCGTTYSVYIIALDAARNYAGGQPTSLRTADCSGGGTGGGSTGSTGGTGGGTGGGTSGSSASFPTGNLPGWSLIFADDFTKDAALGSWASDCDPEKIVYTGATGTKWRAYPKCYKDTYQKRPYRSDQVLSVNNGNLDFWLHQVDGQPAGANPSPVINGNSQYQTYGRYSARVKVDNTDLSEYYMAWLLWPENESMWASAESDYPEGNLRPGRTGVHGFFHYAPGQQEAFGDNSVDLHEWHTYTQEWTPLTRKYYVDDRLIHTTSNWVYNQPQRWQLQTETNGYGNGNGHLLVDWVAVYSYTP